MAVTPFRRNGKSHAARKLRGSMFYRTEVIANWSLHCGHRDFGPFLLLWPWPWLDNIHLRTRCAKMNFLCQRCRKLSSDRETDMTEIVYHAASRVVLNSLLLACQTVRSDRTPSMPGYATTPQNAVNPPISSNACITHLRVGFSGDQLWWWWCLQTWNLQVKERVIGCRSNRFGALATSCVVSYYGQ